MNAITHPVEAELVMALVDGELGADEAQKVSAHVAECAECAGLAAGLREASASIAQWHVGVAPQSLSEAIAGYAARANLGLRISPRKGSHSVRTWRRWAAFGVAAAAMTLLALAISLPTMRRPAAVSGLVKRELWQLPEEQRSASNVVTQGDDVADEKTAAKDFYVPGVAPPPSPPPLSTESFGRIQQFAKAQSADSAPMIARTVSLSIVVKDFSMARKSLDAILARHQGYAAQTNVSTPENAARSLQASLRVPASVLAAAAADLKALGRVENESQSGEEVTRQHEDLVARLKTARETEERFRAILNQRTGTVYDVLQVEEGIARVRGEIEQMEAEQKALEHRVDFATIELQLTEEYKAELNGPESAGTRMHNAFVAGFQSVGSTIFGIALFAEEYGPVLVLWAAILAAPVVFFRNRYKKRLAAVE